MEDVECKMVHVLVQASWPSRHRWHWQWCTLQTVVLATGCDVTSPPNRNIERHDESAVAHLQGKQAWGIAVRRDHLLRVLANVPMLPWPNEASFFPMTRCGYWHQRQRPQASLPRRWRRSRLLPQPLARRHSNGITCRAERYDRSVCDSPAGGSCCRY